MTDKIKEARELAQCGEWETLVTDYPKTILKALSAYEKLQGVDLERLKESILTVDIVFDGYDPTMVLSHSEKAILNLLCAARLVADIGKDG